MRIFFLDVGKQFITAAFGHMFNVVLSVIVTKDHDEFKDECASFLVSLLLDSTLGVVITLLVLNRLNKVLKKYNKRKLIQGYYLHSNGQINYDAYVSQVIIWIFIAIFVV
jgi:hypothetical protein